MEFSDHYILIDARAKYDTDHGGVIVLWFLPSPMSLLQLSYPLVKGADGVFALCLD